MATDVSDLTNFVVGINDSQASRRAFEWACRQAGDGTVAVIHAFPPIDSLFAASAMIDLDPARARHVELLEGDWSAAPPWSTATITTAIVDDDVVDALIAAAADIQSSVIVIGHDADGHHMGHIASHLLRTTERPVVIVPSNSTIEPVGKMVVVALHSSVSVERGLLEFGAHLAAERGARLHVVSVVATSMHVPPVLTYGYGAVEIDPVVVRDATSEVVDEAVREVTAKWPDVQVSGSALTGHPVTALAESAEEVGADVVVVGNHHHSAVMSLITDSVLHRLPSHLSCPVIAVRVG